MGKHRFDAEAEFFAKHCPQTWEIISGRRYILPEYRVPDYANQIELINEYVQELADVCSGTYRLARRGLGERIDTIYADLRLANLVQSLSHNRPTLFLERELGEKLMRTRLPDGPDWSQVPWRHPQMRIILPCNLLSSEVQTHSFYYRYMDLLRLENRSYRLSPQFLKELETNPRILRNRANSGLDSLSKESTAEWCGFAILSNEQCLDKENENWDLVSPQGWSNIDTEELNQSQNYQSVYDPAEPEKASRRAKHLALNLLFYLASSPEDFDLIETLRIARTEGKRFIAGLYKAKFVGDAQRKKITRSPEIIASKAERTAGVKHAQHWVAGHWRNQAHGVEMTLRKWIWIQPYQTLGDQACCDLSPS